MILGWGPAEAWMNRPLESLMNRGIRNPFVIAVLLCCTSAVAAQSPKPTKEAQTALKALGELGFSETKGMFTAADGERFPVYVQRSGVALTDGDLRKLPDIPFVFGLNLRQTQVTDAGLKELARHPALISLGLSGTQVTDLGSCTAWPPQPLSRIHAPALKTKFWRSIWHVPRSRTSA